ncbi:MAG TPA: hypothetical protein VMT94_05580 [Burkholderiales bacterium]|nr:hypothetical protein [Burkholderiales bacterium]
MDQKEAEARLEKITNTALLVSVVLLIVLVIAYAIWPTEISHFIFALFED